MKQIDESSLSRIWSYFNKYDCGFISAFISTKKKEELQQTKKFTEEEKKFYLYTKNLVKSNMLFRDLKNLGYQVTQFRGKWGKDENEMSWFVVDVNETGNLKKDLLNLGFKYGQRSIMVCYKGTQDADELATSFYPGDFNGEILSKYDKRYIGGVEDQDYKSVLKGNRGIVYGNKNESRGVRVLKGQHLLKEVFGL